jgi:hypothetical protein
MRYCFERDDDCHCYLIPLDKKESFHNWMKRFIEVGYYSDAFYSMFGEFSDEFSSYIIDDFENYSFVNPEKLND